MHSFKILQQLYCQKHSTHKTEKQAKEEKYDESERYEAIKVPYHFFRKCFWL